MGLLSKSDLLTKEDLEVKKVFLNEQDWVYVRQMTAHERDNYEQSLMKNVKKPDGTMGLEQRLDDFRAKLAVNVICDDKGELLLEPGEYQKLSKNMSAATLEKIVNEAQKMNNISQEDKEGLVKNSVSGPTGDSNSGSADN